MRDGFHAANYPAIRRVCRITELSANGIVLDYESNSFEEVMVLAVDTSFYNIFDYPFLQTAKAIENAPSGIVITESLAQRIFGETDVLGEGLTVHYDTLKRDFTIAGVMGTMTDNSHLNFDALVSFDAFDKYLRGSTTYIELDWLASGKMWNQRSVPTGKCLAWLGPASAITFCRRFLTFTLIRVMSERLPLLVIRLFRDAALA